jgi:hypothetical protein
MSTSFIVSLYFQIMPLDVQTFLTAKCRTYSLDKLVCYRLRNLRSDIVRPFSLILMSHNRTVPEDGVSTCTRTLTYTSNCTESHKTKDQSEHVLR